MAAPASEQTHDLNLVQALREAMTIAMETDPKVMIMGLDVGRLGGIFRATDGLLERFGSDRVVDMPLAEAAAHVPSRR